MNDRPNPTAKRAVRVQAVVCSVIYFACVLVANPFGLTTMSDDWSYVRTAEVLARTGHIVYNGWANPILGFQLVPAALFIRLFGAPYASARASTVLEACLLAFVLQRLYFRLGLRDRAATLTTLTFLLSPIFLVHSLFFMTDIFGLLTLAATAYGCVRCVQATHTRAAIAWLSVAAVIGFLGGTARQTVWVGVLLMLPAAAWLKRSRQPIVTAAVVLLLGAGAAIAAVLYWYQQQPYSLPESVLPRTSGLKMAGYLLASAYGGVLTIALLSFPVLVLFVAPLWRRSRRLGSAAVGAALLFTLVAALLYNDSPARFRLLPPFLPASSSAFTVHGIAMVPPKGERDITLSLPTRTVMEGCTLLGVSALLVFAWHFRRRDQGMLKEGLSWHQLLVLFFPFCAAYTILLIPRATTNNSIYERYFLPLLVLLLPAATRFLQERAPLSPLLPGYLSVAIMGAYSVAWTHDALATYRASQQATKELLDTGVPRNALDGGWEFNGETQLNTYPTVNNPHSRGWIYMNRTNPLQSALPTCQMVLADSYNAVRPEFVLSFSAGGCGTDTGLPPVKVDRWIGSREQQIHVLKLTRPSQH